VFETGPVRKTRLSTATQRCVAVGFAAVALAALLGGVFGRAALVDEGIGASMTCGFKSCDACVERSCITTSTIELAEDVRAGGGRASPAWGYAGAIAWWTALVGALGLVLAIAMIATGKYVRIPVMSPTTIALVGGGGALIAGCVFIATKPEGVAVTSVGWSFWSFGAGAVGTILSAFLLSRQLAAIEPEFDPGEDVPTLPEEPWQDP